MPKKDEARKKKWVLLLFSISAVIRQRRKGKEREREWENIAAAETREREKMKDSGFFASLVLFWGSAVFLVPKKQVVGFFSPFGCKKLILF